MSSWATGGPPWCAPIARGAAPWRGGRRAGSRHIMRRPSGPCCAPCCSSSRRSPPAAGRRRRGFYRPAHGHVFDAIITLDDSPRARSTRSPSPPSSSGPWLAAGVDVVALTELAADTPATSNAASYARIVASAGPAAPPDRRRRRDRRGWLRRAAMIPTTAIEWARALVRSKLASRRPGRHPFRLSAPPGGPVSAPTPSEAAGHTEADPVGILVCCLAAFGAVVGAGPYMNAGNVTHGLKSGRCPGERRRPARIGLRRR